MAESIKCLTCRYLNNCGFIRKRICRGYGYGMFEPASINYCPYCGKPIIWNEEPPVEEELEVSPHTDYSDENIIKENERWEP